MGFFGKKRTESKEVAPKDYVLEEDAELPVAQVIEIPYGAPPPPVAPSAPIAYQQKTSNNYTGKAPTIPSTCLTRFPTHMESCPCCQTKSRTRVVTGPTWITWTLCVIILFIFWPLCWIPLVMTKTKQSDHYCMNCNMKVGTVGACDDCCVQTKY